MSRPCKKRLIKFNPSVTYYKPAGIPISELEEIVLEKDEVQALKLCDSDGLNQKDASRKMQVSQPTFNRILSSGRKKLSFAITSGKAIKIKK